MQNTHTHTRTHARTHTCMHAHTHTHTHTPVNLGDDADTVGAIYGQLAGAYYGVEAIPEEWRKLCSFSALIELFADELYQLAKTISIPDSTDWSKVNAQVPHEKCESIIRANMSRPHSLVPRPSHCSFGDHSQYTLGQQMHGSEYFLYIAAVSQAYQNIKLKGYDLLEEKNKDIVRKLNPCPKQYKT